MNNHQLNLESLFTHINRFYLGSMTVDELNKIKIDHLAYGAIVYDKTNHVMKVVSENEGSKVWKTLKYEE